jgi:Abnormal spindle-like microcephaly-assoc'd, ASPM-SPD-2-Hydin
VNVGKTGQQDVTLFNKGPLPITVSAVQANPSAEFAATTDCPSTGLVGGQSCHVTVRFTPASKGARSGTVTITDDAAGTPQTIFLTGTGAAPQVAFVPASGLDFGSSVRAGTPGMLKTVTLINSGDGQLTIASMTSDDPVDFKVDGSACPVAPYTLAPGGQCPIGVTFVPSIAGPYGTNVPNTNLAAANLVVVDDAGTQKLPLSGIAAGPGSQLTVGNVVIAGVDFGQQPVNATSLPATVTLTNNGSDPLVISKIVMSGDFSETDTCGTLPATIAAGASCTLSIQFTPSQVGKGTGTLTITDNAGNGQQSITLTGLGVNVSGRRQGSGIHRELLIGPIVAIPIQP